MIVVGMIVCEDLLDAVVMIYGGFRQSKTVPIKGFLQAAEILVFCHRWRFFNCDPQGRSPWAMLAGIGAVTAVLMLVFKDSLMGLVACAQIIANDLIDIGDWVEMPKYGADGHITDIGLHAVRVQNFDKTITSIPTSAFVSDAFKNWRGMQHSGGRRIKRAIYIDESSIKFCTEKMLERFGKFQLLSSYLQEKRRDVDSFNADHDVDLSELVNGRHLTNVGTFRAYITSYLRHHPKIRDDMTLLVRQLSPTEHGLPIELYAYCVETGLVAFEGVQADIFDHVLSVAPEFELRLFQNPAGHDFRQYGSDRELAPREGPQKRPRRKRATGPPAPR